jgi:hypothetical protein
MDNDYILYSGQFIYDLQNMGFTVGMLVEKAVEELLSGDNTDES